jgi:hypothetical protein
VDSKLISEPECQLEISLVADDELLYRRIFSTVDGDTAHYQISPEGKISFTKRAFADRCLKPSVDRAILHEYDPTKTQLKQTDGVIGLIAKDIRVNEDNFDNKGNITGSHKINVIHRPKSENQAHARIEPSPEYASDKVFKRLQQRLARLADERLAIHGWEIKPDGLE